MNGDDESDRRRAAAGWLVIAREDVRVARACPALNPPAPGVAAYHCQQAAEKLVKGLPAAVAAAFRKTQDIDELAELAASSYPECRDLLNTICPLTVWGRCLSLSRGRGYPRTDAGWSQAASGHRHHRAARPVTAHRDSRPKLRPSPWSPGPRDERGAWETVSQTRRLAAILAADIAGYSRLMGASEEGTLRRLKALRAELIDPTIAGHNGRTSRRRAMGCSLNFPGRESGVHPARGHGAPAGGPAAGGSRGFAK
jgi:hypothetical protein